VRIESDWVIFTYRHRSGGEDWQDESYPIHLDWTDCNLGGKRFWFLCPARGCGRRVAVLYSSGIFACRHCYQLAYPSQRETGYNQPNGTAGKQAPQQAGLGAGLSQRPWREKPKGMHWNTFKRLTAQHDAFVQVLLAKVAARLNLLGESIEDRI